MQFKRNPNTQSAKAKNTPVTGELIVLPPVNLSIKDNTLW